MLQLLDESSIYKEMFLREKRSFRGAGGRSGSIPNSASYVG